MHKQNVQDQLKEWGTLDENVLYKRENHLLKYQSILEDTKSDWLLEKPAQEAQPGDAYLPLTIMAFSKKKIIKNSPNWNRKRLIGVIFRQWDFKKSVYMQTSGFNYKKYN